ncbi:MAG: glycosyltransferase family 4 protein [Gammaproteobacteria bacterium]
MRILYHYRLASKDGQYVHLEGVVGALRTLGHEVIIAGPKLAENQGFGGESRWVRRFKRWMPQALYEVAECGYSFLDYFRMSRAIRQCHPDFVYERYNLFFTSGLWIRRRHRLPWLIEVNAPLFDERCAYGGLRLKKLARWTERSVWCGADHVFAVTQVLAERIEREGVARERVTVTPNGVDTAAFERLPPRCEAKQRLGLADGVVLGFTGFIREWHGLERVLVAMQQWHAPSHFLLVGDGPARVALEERARALGIAANITFTGIIGRSQVVRFINAFDIALQPDVVAYASPLKLFEYMAAACAIVAPDRPNIREILTHDVNAWLFDPDDPDSFVAGVARLADDPVLRQRLGSAARATICQRRLTWIANAERIMVCARALIDSNDSGPRLVFEPGKRGD